MHRYVDRFGKLRPVDRLICLAHPVNLRPSRLHQRFLIALHHAAAKTRHDPVRGVGVQLAEPTRIHLNRIERRALLANAVLTGLMAGIHPGAYARQIGVGVVAFIHPVAQRGALRRGPVCIKGGICRGGCGGIKRAFKNLHSAGAACRKVWDATSGHTHIYHPPPDGPGGGNALQLFGQRFEIARRPGGKFPTVIHRQDDLQGRVTVVGRPHPGIGQRARPHPQTRLYPAIKRRHQSCDIAHPRCRIARTDQARQVGWPVFIA